MKKSQFSPTQIARELHTERPKNISKACRLLRLGRSNLQYQSIKNDEWVMSRLETLAKQHPVEGFWKCYDRIRNAGETINHKHSYMVHIISN